MSFYNNGMNPERFFTPGSPCDNDLDAFRPLKPAAVHDRQETPLVERCEFGMDDVIENSTKLIAEVEDVLRQTDDSETFLGSKGVRCDVPVALGTDTPGGMSSREKPLAAPSASPFPSLSCTSPIASSTFPSNTIPQFQSSAKESSCSASNYLLSFEDNVGEHFMDLPLGPFDVVSHPRDSPSPSRPPQMRTPPMDQYCARDTSYSPFEFSKAATVQKKHVIAFPPVPCLPSDTNFYESVDEDLANNVAPCGGASNSFGEEPPPPPSRTSSPLSLSENGRSSPSGSQSTVATVSAAAPAASTSPIPKRDSFIDDDYAKYKQATYDGENDDDQELASLLKRPTNSRFSSCLEGWQVADQPDGLQSYVTRERAQGMDRIHRQAAQLFQVFREFNHLVHQQQDDLELLDDTMIHIKTSTGSAVEELKKANKRKQAARKRKLFLITITVFVGLLLFVVYVVPAPSVSTLFSHPPDVVPTTMEQPTARAGKDASVQGRYHGHDLDFLGEKPG